VNQTFIFDSHWPFICSVELFSYTLTPAVYFKATAETLTTALTKANKNLLATALQLAKTNLLATALRTANADILAVALSQAKPELLRVALQVSIPLTEPHGILLLLKSSVKIYKLS
jgi:hypothetical protein